MRFLHEYEPLVQPAVLVGSSVLYVALAIGLYKVMRSREAMTLKGAMMVYNVTQVVVCSAMTIGLLNAMRGGEPIQILNTNFSLPNVFATSTDFTPAAEFWILVHYLTKFLDFFDTIFIALRKKDRQMSFLHVYHHATIGPIWGLLLYLGYGGATASFGACINSFTHVLMYTHYFVSALGIRHPFKPFITSWQIFQFYSCIAHAIVCLTPLETVYPKNLALLQFGYHLTMIVLFTSFFKRTYGDKAKGSAEEEAAAQKAKPQPAENGKANGQDNRRAAKPAQPAGGDEPVANVHSKPVANGHSKPVRRRRVAATT